MTSREQVIEAMARAVITDHEPDTADFLAAAMTYEQAVEKYHGEFARAY
jgi:hypothetical protein